MDDGLTFRFVFTDEGQQAAPSHAPPPVAAGHTTPAAADKQAAPPDARPGEAAKLKPSPTVEAPPAPRKPPARETSPTPKGESTRGETAPEPTAKESPTDRSQDRRPRRVPRVDASGESATPSPRKADKQPADRESKPGEAARLLAELIRHLQQIPGIGRAIGSLYHIAEPLVDAGKRIQQMRREAAKKREREGSEPDRRPVVRKQLPAIIPAAPPAEAAAAKPEAVEPPIEPPEKSPREPPPESASVEEDREGYTLPPDVTGEDAIDRLLSKLEWAEARRSGQPAVPPAPLPRSPTSVEVVKPEFPAPPSEPPEQSPPETPAPRPVERPETKPTAPPIEAREPAEPEILPPAQPPVVVVESPAPRPVERQPVERKQPEPAAAPPRSAPEGERPLETATPKSSTPGATRDDRPELAKLTDRALAALRPKEPTAPPPVSDEPSYQPEPAVTPQPLAETPAPRPVIVQQRESPPPEPRPVEPRPVEPQPVEVSVDVRQPESRPAESAATSPAVDRSIPAPRSPEPPGFRVAPEPSQSAALQKLIAALGPLPESNRELKEALKPLTELGYTMGELVDAVKSQERFAEERTPGVEGARPAAAEEAPTEQPPAFGQNKEDDEALDRFLKREKRPFNLKPVEQPPAPRPVVVPPVAPAAGEAAAAAPATEAAASGAAAATVEGGAAAAEGGAVAAGAAFGPAGIAASIGVVAVVGTATRAISGLAKAARAADDSLSQVANRLAPYNGDLAFSQANAQMRKVMNDVQLASRIGESLARYNDAQARADRAWDNLSGEMQAMYADFIGTHWQNVKAEFYEGMLDALKGIESTVGKIFRGDENARRKAEQNESFDFDFGKGKNGLDLDPLLSAIFGSDERKRNFTLPVPYQLPEPITPGPGVPPRAGLEI